VPPEAWLESRTLSGRRSGTAHFGEIRQDALAKAF
jgi:hypothetical protein